MASEIGQALREARLAQGIELDEAQRVTKIRARYLEALENEQWEKLPDPAYVRGFLRTYAGYLDLDANALVAAYRGEHREEEDPGPIPRDMLPRKGQVERHPGRRRHALLALVVIAIGLIIVIVIARGGGDRSTSGPLEPERTDAVAGSGGSSEPDPVPADNDGQGSEPKPTPMDPDKVEVDLRATGPVWVCLTRGGGEVLVNGETIAAGDGRGPYEGGAFEVTLGNGSVELDVDGRPLEIPARAEPQGYRINPDGAKELDSAERPTCA